eukprot:jgi/Chrzof1/2568/Cz11g20190.t1
MSSHAMLLSSIGRAGGVMMGLASICGAATRRLAASSSSHPSLSSGIHTGTACLQDHKETPVTGQLYGREDRDPMPSPAGTVTQGKDAGITDKPEGIEADEAYPVQNDPSVASGEVAPREKPLPQNESSGPKAAGQEEGVGIENAGPTSATSADSEGSTQI